MIKVKTSKIPRICQGDILRDVDFIESLSEKNGILEISTVTFPFVVVLTQDCELEQDYKFRIKQSERIFKNKLLLSVLVAPLYSAKHVFLGEHLSEIDIESPTINEKKTEGKLLKNNNSPRYHYLEFPDQISVAPSIVDFKHYFSVNVEKLRSSKKEKFVCKISELYRESLSERFANYLSRIGLPRELS